MKKVLGQWTEPQCVSCSYSTMRQGCSSHVTAQPHLYPFIHVAPGTQICDQEHHKPAKYCQNNPIPDIAKPTKMIASNIVQTDPVASDKVPFRFILSKTKQIIHPKMYGSLRLSNVPSLSKRGVVKRGSSMTKLTFAHN